MPQQLLTIARNTFIESIRQPIFSIMLIVGVLFFSIATAASAYSMEDDSKFMLDMGFSSLFLVGMFLAAFTAASVLSSEIENKTVLTVVSKPVPRPLFIAGKYLGVISAVGTAYWALTIVFLLAIRHQVMQTAADDLDGPVLFFGGLALFGAALGSAAGNYFYRWVFTSSFVMSFVSLITVAYLIVLVIGPEWNFQPIATEFHKHPLAQILIGIVLLFESLLLLSAVAIAASTRMGQVMTILIVLGFCLLGLLSDYFFGRFHENFAPAAAMYRLSPNLQFFWPGDAIAQGHNITSGYFLNVTGYCALYIGAILCAAVALFQSREVG